jgi:hypothetical protein
MTRDETLTAALVLAFATLATVHVMLVVGLASREPRWRAAAAAIALPLAPIWGLRAGMPLRSGLWIASAIAYIVSRWLASR